MDSIIACVILIVVVFAGCSVIYKTVKGNNINIPVNKRAIRRFLFVIVLAFLVYTSFYLVSETEYGVATALSLMILYMIYLVVR